MSHRSTLARLASTTAAALVAIGSLVACSSGGEVATGTTFDVQVVDPDGANPFALSQVLVGTSALTVTIEEAASTSTAALTTADLVEVDTGLWLGNTVDAQAGATAQVVLPATDEIPAGALANVEQAFLNATNAPDCSVVASPASAVLTAVVFEGFAAPGLVAMTGLGELAPVYLSDATVDSSATTAPDGLRIYTWIHSDSAVDVTFDGTDCDGFDADLSLATGWNTAAWVYDAATTGWTLVDAEAPDPMIGTVAVF